MFKEKSGTCSRMEKRSKSKGILWILLGWEMLGMAEDQEFAVLGFSQHIWTDVVPNPVPSKGRKTGFTLQESSHSLKTGGDGKSPEGISAS